MSHKVNFKGAEMTGERQGDCPFFVLHGRGKARSIAPLSGGMRTC